MQAISVLPLLVILALRLIAAVLSIDRIPVAIVASYDMLQRRSCAVDDVDGIAPYHGVYSFLMYVHIISI